MRHKTWVMVAIAAVAVVMIATPVAAKEPLYGDQTMILNQAPDGSFGAFGCPDISWIGEIEIEDTAYGMALYPLPGKGFTGQGRVLHYTEAWVIFDEEFSFVDGQIADCAPGAVILAGTDSGVGAEPSQKFHSTGIVEEAYPPFDEWLGRRVYQDGNVGLVEFAGDFFFGFYGELRLH